MSGNQDTSKGGGPAAPGPAIPLSDASLGPDGQPSIGNLIKDATASASTLFRAEVALAKKELVSDAKKAGVGTGLVSAVVAMLLFASFFFFIFLAELLSVWLPRWAAFGIVFLLLLFVAIAAAIIAYLIFRRIRGPRRTIATVKQVPEVLPSFGGSSGEDAGDTPTSGTLPDIPVARDPSRG